KSGAGAELEGAEGAVLSRGRADRSFGGKPATGAEIDRAGCALVASLRAQRIADHGREQQRQGCCDRDDAPTSATELNHGISLPVPFQSRLEGYRGSRGRN